MHLYKTQLGQTPWIICLASLFLTSTTHGQANAPQPLYPPPTKYTAWDKIAIDHSLIAFHAYQQIANGEAFDLTKTSLRQFPKPFSSWRKFGEVHLPKPDALLQGWEFKLMQVNINPEKTTSKKEVIGYLAIHPKQKILVLAFKPSRHWQDWKKNLTLSVKKSTHLTYPGYLHAGYVDLFNQNVKSVDAMMQYCTHHVPDLATYTLIICGHSLGGAMAILTASYITEHTPYRTYFAKENVKLIIFGAPHIGFHEKKHNLDTWLQHRIPYIKRFERATDPVPILSRVGRLVYDKKDTFFRLTYLPPSPIGHRIELPSYHDSITNVHQAHHPGKYRKAIYQALHLPYTPIYLRPIPKNYSST